MRQGWEPWGWVGETEHRNEALFSKGHLSLFSAFVITLYLSQSCFFKEMKKEKEVFPGLIIKTVSLERYGGNFCLLVLPPPGTSEAHREVLLCEHLARGGESSISSPRAPSLKTPHPHSSHIPIAGIKVHFFPFNCREN